MLKRRNFLHAAGAMLAAPSIAASETARVFRFTPQGDVGSLDPVWTPNYQSFYHAFMVFDTLFGVDSQLRPLPQMALGATAEDAGQIWRITLRDGLVFHDGEPVLARDCVALIRRWGARDPFGQALLAATDEIAAPDDRTIVFRLRRPFPLLPDALGKMNPNMCPMMPARLAATDPFKQVPEIVGSGPYRFKPDERIPGARLVYERHSRYVPRGDGEPDGIAGQRWPISTASNGTSCRTRVPLSLPCNEGKLIGGRTLSRISGRCCARAGRLDWKLSTPGAPLPRCGSII